MRFVIALLLLVLVTCVFGSTVEEQWAKFKVKFHRSFTSEEDAKRFEQFKKTLASIEEQNAKYARGESSFRAGVNLFADRFDHEKNYTRGLGKLPGVPVP